jgi:hypothetical protein
MQQYNLFGGCDEVKEPEKPSRKMKTMYELFGEREDKKCKTCRYCLKIDYHDRTYYKCQLWKISRCDATDIRINHNACNKWEV